LGERDGHKVRLYGERGQLMVNRGRGRLMVKRGQLMVENWRFFGELCENGTIIFGLFIKGY
jgi:hypothetical protein